MKNFDSQKYLKELEQEARREAIEEELAEGAKRVLMGVALAGAGLLVGFHIGANSAHAATIRAGKFKTAPVYTEGTVLVESIPETFPEEQPPVVTTAANIEHEAITADPPGETWESLGRWKLTAYCPCRKCNGSNAGRTASGAPMEVGRTVAVGGLPFGTQLKINGHVYTVEDRGVTGHHVDILHSDHATALRFGIQYAEVYIKR